MKELSALRSHMLKSMKTGTATSPRATWLDRLLWVLAFVVLVGSFVVNYQWPAFPTYFKVILDLVVAAAIISLLGFTTKGLALFKFSKEARAELRKVHWPARQETIQTTLIVVLMVVVVGLCLWGIDGFFIWVINALTGQ
jgi:preprotein translocase subunit SecE